MLLDFVSGTVNLLTFSLSVLYVQVQAWAFGDGGGGDVCGVGGVCVFVCGGCG